MDGLLVQSYIMFCCYEIDVIDLESIVSVDTIEWSWLCLEKLSIYCSFEVNDN